MGKYDGIELEALVIRVIDGDTIECRVDCPFHFHYTDKFRLKGINTPELKKPEEKKRAEAARDFLKTWIEGQTVLLKVYKQEKYGRWLAEVVYNEASVNDYMIEKGYAKPFMV